VETLAREAEWKRREAHNDAVAVNWEVEASDGWGNTPPVSPIVKGWPDVRPEDRCESFPRLLDVMPLRPDGVEVGDSSLSKNAVYVVTALWLCA
jgi:hypothetical protein